MNSKHGLFAIEERPTEIISQKIGSVIWLVQSLRLNELYDEQTLFIALELFSVELSSSYIAELVHEHPNFEPLSFHFSYNLDVEQSFDINSYCSLQERQSNTSNTIHLNITREVTGSAQNLVIRSNLQLERFNFEKLRQMLEKNYLQLKSTSYKSKAAFPLMSQFSSSSI
ncbi:hypothetical protein, partial [Psychrobacter aquimaris]|uniref:hypothetical protein n=1 Tax=Psychrobacter aquimaris TaxID=292733 RepID=UPI003FD0873B